MDTVQLDNNKSLSEALVSAVKLAASDLESGYVKVNKHGIMGSKRNSKEVMQKIGMSYRIGHMRAIYAAYKAVFFNHHIASLK